MTNPKPKGENPFDGIIIPPQSPAGGQLVVPGSEGGVVFTATGPELQDFMRVLASQSGVPAGVVAGAQGVRQIEPVATAQNEVVGEKSMTRRRKAVLGAVALTASLGIFRGPASNFVNEHDAFPKWIQSGMQNMADLGHGAADEEQQFKKFVLPSLGCDPLVSVDAAVTADVNWKLKDTKGQDVRFTVQEQGSTQRVVPKVGSSNSVGIEVDCADTSAFRDAISYKPDKGMVIKAAQIPVAVVFGPPAKGSAESSAPPVEAYGKITIPPTGLDKASLSEVTRTMHEFANGTPPSTRSRVYNFLRLAELDGLSKNCGKATDEALSTKVLEAYRAAARRQGLSNLRIVIEPFTGSDYAEKYREKSGLSADALSLPSVVGLSNSKTSCALTKTQ